MIDIMKVLDFMRDNATAYAKAKADRVFMDEYRKTLKAQLFFDALEFGHKTVAERESFAYTAEKYKEHLQALKEAIEVEEDLRWKLIAAQAKVEAWRSLEASNRAFDKAVM